MTAQPTEHVIVINRYPMSMARYPEYIDHLGTAVSYVSTSEVAAQVPAEAGDSIAIRSSGHLINSVDDRRNIADAVAMLAARHGTPRALVALFEGDLDIAAELRERYDILGDRPADLAPFRDKLVMHDRAAGGGVRTPASASVTDAQSVIDFGAVHGWPLIVKPRCGTGSFGVRRLDSAAETAGIGSVPGDELMVQRFVSGPIVHADGVAGPDGLVNWRLSRYIGDCLAYNAGAPLGSYELDDPALTTRAGELLERLLASITVRAVVFHAEFIEGADGSLTFLEIAGRPGGAEVHRVWQEVHGIDLLALHARLQMGMDLRTAAEGPDHPAAADEFAGWLLVQPSAARPCVVESVRSAPDGRFYAQDVPPTGTLIRSGGGYGHAARFRFRGSTSTEVAAAITEVADSFRLTCRTVPEDRLILIGSGGRAYREFSMKALLGHARLSLFGRSDPTWQGPYCDTVDRIEDPSALPELVKARLTELGSPSGLGVLSWDESLVEDTAALAASLGVPGIGVAAARRCRDKLRTREALAATPHLAVRHREVRTPQQARDAAAAIGYPVVVKPRSMAGSAGVIRVDDPEQIDTAVAVALGASFPGLPQRDSVLVEEYLEGPEISIDSVVVGGQATCVNVARKRIGFAPSFEEVGHVVRPWRDEAWAWELQELMRDVHRALGAADGVTHGEVRLTSDGPRLVELNCRLGGDFIPLLGALATGVDLVRCAAEVALGQVPAMEPTMDRTAEVRFLYPPRDSLVHEVDLAGCREIAGIAEAIALAGPGDELILPPKGAVGRFAALIAVGASQEQTSMALDEAAARARLTAEPIDE